MSKKSEIVLEDCKATVRKLLAEGKIRIAYLRDPRTCQPTTHAHRELAMCGLPHKVGRGRPVGVAVFMQDGHPSSARIGISRCRPGDQFHKAFGVMQALSNTEITYARAAAKVPKRYRHQLWLAYIAYREYMERQLQQSSSQKEDRGDATRRSSPTTLEYSDDALQREPPARQDR